MCVARGSFSSICVFPHRLEGSGGRVAYSLSVAGRLADGAERLDGFRGAFSWRACILGFAAS